MLENQITTTSEGSLKAEPINEYPEIIGHKIPISALIDRVLTFREKYSELNELGVKGIAGLLFYGSPGTGKTMIVEKVMENLSSLHPGKYKLIRKKSSEFTSSNILGHTDIKLNEFYTELKNLNPSMTYVIFFDEFDSMCPINTTSDNVKERVNSFLTFMIDVQNNIHNVFLVACTNHPDKINAAIISRFCDTIEVPKPTHKEYELFVDKYIHPKILNNKRDSIIDGLKEAASSQQWTGRDFDNLRTKLGLLFVKNGEISSETIIKVCQELRLIRWTTLKGD